jgi:hypothetical protein
MVYFACGALGIIDVTRDIPTCAPMSAIGTKRTSACDVMMSAFGGKADIV